MRKRLILMCGKVLFMGKMCANKSMCANKLCVANTYSGVHGRISMTKPLDFYLIYSNPPLDLCQTLNSYSLGGVEGSFKISTSSGLLQGSYTCWKWRGLKLSVFPSNLVKIVFSFEA